MSEQPKKPINPFEAAQRRSSVHVSIDVHDVQAIRSDIGEARAATLLETHKTTVAQAMLMAGREVLRELLEQRDATEIVQGEEFEVRDAKTANWVVRKVVEARTYAVRVRAWAKLEQRRAQREEEFLLRRFGSELEAWARQQIAQQHDGRRSVNLPAGSVGFRIEPTRLAITDEHRLLTWCRANLASAIRVVESVPKAPLMEHLKTTGECPDGAAIQGGDERFHITAPPWPAGHRLCPAPAAGMGLSLSAVCTLCPAPRQVR